MEDKINHPKHYNASGIHCECGRQIECIDVTKAFSFRLGNAIKYIWRADLKENPLEDLKKARWYLDNQIHEMEQLNIDQF